jgi:parallel beta-helix repeat protein
MVNYAVDNLVENCSVTGNKYHAGITVLSVQGAVPARNIIRNNVVRNIKDDGIMIQGCNACVIERNVVEDAGREGVWLSPGDPGPNNLNSPLGRSNVVRGNVIARARNGIEIDRNANPTIVNNTAIQNRDAGLHAVSDTTGMVVRNNIFAWNADQSMNVTGSVGDRTHSIDYNLYFPGKIRWEGDPPNGPNCNGGCAYQSLAAFRNAGFSEYTQKSIEADPQLTDPASDQFGPVAGSPAIDRGIPVGLPYSGSAPDIGAVEFGGGGGGGDPPPPPPVLLSVEPLAN